MLAKLVPALNIQHNAKSPWRTAVLKARRVMADDAKAWPVAKGFKV